MGGGRTFSFSPETLTPGEKLAIESKQDTANGYLATIAGLTPALGYAVKITVSGTTTYIAKAAAGTTQATAAWQAMKLDESSGLVITWADGNTSFDNVATDLTALTYS